MDVTGIGNSYSSYSSYGKIASGTRIQSASDGAAEMAIAEKQDAQARGYDAGVNNAKQANDMLNVADGALCNITDSIQRMRELAMEASSGLLTDSDRGHIQREIDQLKQGIADAANNTTFNTKALLNGDQSFNIATDAQGNSREVTTGNATLHALGIADFDVTKGDFDIGVLDDAIDSLSSQRGSIGAQSNGLDFTVNFTSYASQNTVGAKSRIEDLDMETAISDQKKKELLNTYAMMMKKRQQEEEANRAARLFQ